MDNFQLMATYDTHDNHNRPLQIKIYASAKETRVDIFRDKLKIHTINTPSRIFMGISPVNTMTIFSGGFGPEAQGNTFLINTHDNEYVYLQKNIVKFHTDSPIVTFMSPLGNNDVPYPYAIDANGRYYLLGYDWRILSQVPPNVDDIYDYYYKLHRITPLQDSMPVIETNIEKWFIDGEEYSLTIDAPAEQNMQIKYKNQEPVNITAQELKQIQDNFNDSYVHSSLIQTMNV